MTDLDYGPLSEVLDAALAQASAGKGSYRHANGRHFCSQPMMEITHMVGLGFPLGQAMKKAQEAARMMDRGEPDHARHELLGAIVYLAGAVIAIEEKAND